jgi:hypothetical protein
VWSSKRRWSFYALDQLFAVVVVGPLVVGFWRGTWLLLDLYLTPDDPKLSNWITLVVGNAGLFVLAVLQEPLKALRPHNKVLQVLLLRFYIYAASVFSVCQWRGVWVLLDLYHGMTAASFI